MRYSEILAEALNMELTIKNWAEPLRERIKRDPLVRQFGGRSDQFLIELIAEFDPTPAKKYLINWILPRYINGGINAFEDLEGIKEDLTNFERYKQRMPIKDILQIKTAADLSKMVRETLRPPGSVDGPNGVVSYEEVRAANSESIRVYEDDELLVVIPLTQRAAGFWGRYSNWCTAYGYKWGQYPDRTSLFNNYDGPGQRLLIWINKSHPDRDSSNYQSYYSQGPFDNDIQIMDLEDYDCTDDFPIDDYIAKLNNEQIQIIVDNCMAGYNQDPCRIRNGRIEVFTELENVIADFGNHGAEYVYRVITSGDAHDYVHVETDLRHIIAHEIPRGIENALEAYLTRKYPEDMEEFNEDLHEVLDSNQSEEHEIIDQLRTISYHGYVRGAEAQMWHDFDSALVDAGITLVEPNNYEGMCILRGPTVRKWLGHPKLNEGGEKFIKLEEPSYGWEGYDDSVWTDASDLMGLLEK